MSYNKRTLNLKDTKKNLAPTSLMPSKSPTLYCCKHCNTQDISWWEHLEQCKYTYGTFQKNNGDLEVKMGSRSQELHKAIKNCYYYLISWCPDIIIKSHHEPLVIDHFDLDTNHCYLSEIDIMQPEYCADILLDAMGESRCYEKYLVDLTINSSHVRSNLNCHFEFHYNNKYFRWVNAGVAKKA